MRGTELIEKLPVELWFYILFSFPFITAKDVLNFLLCDTGTAAFASRLREDSYAMRKWFALLPYDRLASAGEWRSFVDRHTNFQKPFTNVTALFNTCMAADASPARNEVLGILASQMDMRVPGMRQLGSNALGWKKSVALRVLIKAGIPINSSGLQAAVVLAVMVKDDELFDTAWSLFTPKPHEFVSKIAFGAAKAGFLHPIRRVWEWNNRFDADQILCVAVQYARQDIAAFVMQKHTGNAVAKCITVANLKGAIYRGTREFVEQIFGWLGYTLFLESDDPVHCWIAEHALVYAAGASKLEMFKFILSRVTPNYEEAFLNACRFGSFETVEYLFNEAKQPETSVPERIIFHMENLPFRTAAANGHTKVVALLFGYPRVYPSSHRYFALRKAAMHGHTSVVKFLLEHDKNPTKAIESMSNWAIRKSLESGHTRIAHDLCRVSRQDFSQFL